MHKYEHSKHRQFLENWWDHHGHWLVPKEAIPENSSYLIFKNDSPVCFGALYLTNSKTAILSWITANPNIGLKTRYKSLKYMVDRIQAVAYISGARLILSNMDSSGLAKMMKNEGYTPAGDHTLMCTYLGGM